ncbi:hypothetical protein HPB47_021021 [Ixodes persulcatus]|uniref:Uncharacterized protein n=1 Tax=Ixodes persulcatus TaxID=34615 RepID=A0AC60QDP4_IXOPE|nr:hypothetical protein HPB47_021021 [Ixodes persulcatus]
MTGRLLPTSGLQHAFVAFRRALAARARSRLTRRRSVSEGRELALRVGQRKNLAHPASAVPLSTAWLDPWERHRLAKIGLRRCSVGRAGAPAERRPCCGASAAGGVDSVELLVIWEPSRDASVVALRRGPHGAQAMCSLCPRLSRRKPLKTVRFDSFVDTISYCDDLAAAAAAVAPAQIKAQFSKIHQLFLKHNTAVPSSASVERLFSVAGDVF